MSDLCFRVWMWIVQGCWTIQGLFGKATGVRIKKHGNEGTRSEVRNRECGSWGGGELVMPMGNEI